MKVLQWIKNTAKAFVQYFKPANPNLSIELEQETLLDIQEPTEEELEIVIELLTQVETGQNNDSVSAYTVVSSLLSLILSKENLPRIGVAAVFTGINTGFNFIAPWLLGETIKILMSQDETTHIAGIDFTRSALIVTMVSAYTLSQILPNIRDQILEPVTENNTKKILEKATAHLLKKSLDYQVNTPFDTKKLYSQLSWYAVINPDRPNPF
jgi:hypothetical protein